MTMLCLWLSSESKTTAKDDSSSEESKENVNSTILSPQEILDAISQRPTPFKNSETSLLKNQTTSAEQFSLMYPTESLFDAMSSANESKINETSAASSTSDVLEHSQPDIGNATVYLNKTNSGAVLKTTYHLLVLKLMVISMLVPIIVKSL
jgi:hypothetical protein